MATTKVTKFSLAQKSVDASKIDADAPTEDNQLLQTDINGSLSWVTPANADSGFVFIDVKNETGNTIPLGTGLMAVGTDGNSGHILVEPMIADGSIEPKYYIGVLEEELLNGELGRAVTQGIVNQINTNAFPASSVLWCDPANPGGFTTTEPSGPNVKISTAIVLSSKTNGKIFVRVQGNEGLHELHDVNVSLPINGSVLTYNYPQGVWENSKTIFAHSINIGGDYLVASSQADGVFVIQGDSNASMYTDFDGLRLGVATTLPSSNKFGDTLMVTVSQDLHVAGDVVAFSSSFSDEKLKDNVATIPNALDKISKLRGVSYEWNKGSRKGQKDFGVIAQEVEEVLPELVREQQMHLVDGETYKTVDYEKIVGVLIQAVKELKAEVEELKAK